MDGVAIVGMAGRFPGANDVEAFWRNLRAGAESVTFFTEEELRRAGVPEGHLRDPEYVRARGVLDEVECFDAAFFGLSPREAERMDPQHRIFLEGCWAALERAGYDPSAVPGSVAVYAGESLNTYLVNNLFPGAPFDEAMDDLQTLIGGDKDFLATRVSYHLDLSGPSVVVQSACSTALVAVAQAFHGLLGYQCDVALAGGVSVRVPQERGYRYREGGTMPPDGHCRPFDAEARGTTFNNGMGVVVLKRLEDAVRDRDHVHAVIRGCAVNNDGNRKVGYTAPSPERQAEVIALAHAVAGVHPDTIRYVEAHGTGTPLGDPIEVDALTRAFRRRTAHTGFCALGSVKSNIGHLDAAAGAAGLIKAALALEHNEIPASLHFTTPNPAIDFAGSPFFVNTALRPWPAAETPRRAAVSSFGIGGTNAHVVLEEAPAPQAMPPRRTHHLLVISAKTGTALERAAARLADHLAAHPAQPLADVAYTLHVGRRPFDHRRAVACHDRAQAIAALRNRAGDAARPVPEAPPRVAFVFPGQGAQHPGMGRGLYETEPVFRSALDRCAELLRPAVGVDLRDLLVHEAHSAETHHRLQQTVLAQPAIFSVSYALARVWRHWGVTPQAMLGHSIGEYVAACLAGVFSLEDALRVIAERGRLMQSLPGGAMLAVGLAAQQVASRLPNDVVVAADNGPETCVVSGPADAVAAFGLTLEREGVSTQALHTSHAFHSPMMDPMLEAFRAAFRPVALRAPSVPLLSSVTGTWMTDEDATDPEYWARQVREPVRFGPAIATLLDGDVDAFVEVGPGRTLTALAAPVVSQSGRDVLAIPSMRHASDATRSDAGVVQEALGRLWCRGVAVDWGAYHDHERPRRVPLPSYPFERTRHWVAPATASDAARNAPAIRARPDDWFYQLTWNRTPAPRPSRPDPKGSEDRWLVFADGSERDAFVTALHASGIRDHITVATGDAPAADGADGRHVLDPDRPTAYRDLVTALPDDAGAPIRVVYLWSLQPDPSSLLRLHLLLQALGRRRSATDIDLTVVTRQGQEVVGDEHLEPTQAALAALCTVANREYASITCRCVDIVGPDDAPLTPALAAQVRDEILAGARDGVVAYRGRYRWTRGVEATRLPPPAARPRRLRDGGVYLVTGGLGGVGLTVARYLASTCRARLALVSRRGLPPADAWDDPGHPADVRERIRGVRRLERSGADVLVLRADVSNGAEIRAAVASTVARFGAIHGVIHAAGVPGAGPLDATTADDTARVAGPKTAGTETLADALAACDLDFFLLCSSLASLLGGPGQGAYAAANAYLDATALRRRGPFVSIAWDAWRDVGMGADPDFVASAPGAEDTLRHAVTPDEALDVLARVLDADLPHVLVSTRDLDARLEAQRALVPSPPTDADSPRVSGDAVEPAARETEAMLLSLWRQLLGVEAIGIHDDFFALGGHSLLATQLLNRIRQQHPDADLSLRAVFDHPTVSRLAAVIDGAPPAAPHAEASDPPSRDGPRNEVERGLVELWRQLLGSDRIGIHDDFFELGGHSLLATQLLNRLRQQYPNATVSLRTVFDHPTIAGLAALLATDSGHENATGASILERLAGCAPSERVTRIERYLRDQFAEALEGQAADPSGNGDLTDHAASRLTAHLVVALRRDLQLQVYPPELRSRLTVPALAGFVAEELARAPSPNAGTPGAAAVEIRWGPSPSPARAVRVARQNPPAVFVLSSPRSGSTLLRLMLSGHSRLFCPPELSLLGFDGMGAWRADPYTALQREGLVRAFMAVEPLDVPAAEALVDALADRDAPVQEVYRRLQEGAAPRVLVDKTPAYALHVETMRRAERRFDGARYIHLVRHPYAVIDSLVRGRFDRLRGDRGDPHAIGEAYWQRCNANIAAFTGEIDPSRSRRIRYEDLVTAPGPVMRSLCEFLGIPFEETVLRPYDHGRVFAGPGDPNISSHREIDASLGDAWKAVKLPAALDPATRALAADLGYEMPATV